MVTLKTLQPALCDYYIPSRVKFIGDITWPRGDTNFLFGSAESISHDRVSEANE